MSNPILKIEDPGIFTTVQDCGRYGFQRIGVPVSGALDQFAFRVANVLVGNDECAATLEMAVIGPTITFLDQAWISITGGDLSPALDGAPMPIWESTYVREGSRLTFNGMKDGMRAYLAVAGGIDVPMVMGSRSTYLPGGFGGLEGRAVKQGDKIGVLPLHSKKVPVRRRLPDGHRLPNYGNHHELRVILGPQHDLFTEDGINTFLGSVYTVSIDSDRMGYLLDGPSIGHKIGSDIVSDGNPMGSIQVSGDGVPTILLADRGTTGGYAKIATVISADFSKVAQAVPGHRITCNVIELDQAREIREEQESMITALSDGKGDIEGKSHVVSITVNGTKYEVIGEDDKPLTVEDPMSGSQALSAQNVRATVGDVTYDFIVDTDFNADSEA